MRGTLSVVEYNLVWYRITPAHAGNTSVDIEISSQRRDHPRPCGEHVIEVFVMLAMVGSPPPMRGTP